MIRPFYRLALALSLMASAYAAGAPAGTSTAPFCEQIERQSDYQVGIALQWLQLGKIPGIAPSFSAYGVLLQARVLGPLHAYGQATHASAEGSTVYLIDAGAMLELTNPYLHTFVLLGANYFRFDSAANNGARTTLNTGVGIAIRMGEMVEVPLTLKTYFQEPLMFSVGGGLMVRL